MSKYDMPLYPYSWNEDVPEHEVCEVCGREVDELHFGVCDYCLEKNTNFENVIEFGDENKKKIEINGFLGYVFSDLEIEQILKKEYLECKNIGNYVDENIEKDYIFEEIYDFASFLKR